MNDPFADLNANFNQGRLATLGQSQQPAAPAAPAQHGNFWTHLIPSLGGTAGGIGGAAIGTALLPGIGTLAGALLGGALGGGAGKVVENHQEHQALGNGVAGQAIENGVLSAGPGVLFKGAKALVGAAPEIGTGAKTLAEAISGAGNAATAPSTVGRIINGVKTGAADRSTVGLGVKVGDTVGGKMVAPDAAASLKNWADNQAAQYGDIRPGTPMNQARDAQNVFNNVTGKLNQRLDQINRPVTGAEKQQVNDAIDQAISKDGGITSSPDTANKYQSLIANAKDLKDLEAIRQQADNLAFKESGGNGSSQTAYQAGHVRQAIDGLLTPLDSQYKNIKGDYQTAKQLLHSTSTAADAAQGTKIPFIPNATLPAQASQGIKNVANATLTKIPGIGMNPLSPTAIAGRDTVGGLAGAVTGNQSNIDNTSPTTTNSATTPNISNNMDASSQNNGNLSSDSASQSPYTQDALAYDIARDPANAAKYLSTYSSLDKIFNPAGNSLTTNQKNEVVSQQKASDLLNQYTQNLQATGGGNGPIMGRLLDAAGAMGMGGQAASVHAMLPNKMEMAAAIAGALNPRGTVSPTVTNKIAEMLPTPLDSHATVQDKLQLIQSMISAGAYSGTTPISDLVAGQTANQPATLDAATLQAMGYGQ